MTRSVIIVLVLITLLAVACSSAHTPGSEFSSPEEAPSLNLLAGTVTGLEPATNVSLRVEQLEEGANDQGQVVFRFDAANGCWEQVRLAPKPGRYRLVPEVEGYVSIPRTITFRVPEDGIVWRYTHLDFEFLHPNDASARFGVPLCPELPPHGGVFVVLEGTPGPTLHRPGFWAPGTCYAGYFYDSEIQPAGLQGHVSGLSTGQTATITFYVLPPVPGENYMVGPPPPADGSWVYPPDVTDLKEQPPIVPDWPLTATLTVGNGPWGLVDPSLVGHKYLVVAGATDEEARPPAYEVVVFGGKMPGFPSSVDFTFRPETTSPSPSTEASPEALLPTSTIAAPPPPTEAPPGDSLPTSTIATPPSAYATQDAARRTAIVARATASPFPTAGPSTVQLGEPSVATARRDGLSLEVRLPKDTYLAGEGNRAEVTLRNDSPETVVVKCDREHSSWLVLLDEQGHELAPWPWTPMSGPGWNRCFGKELAPGQVLTDTLTLQIPAAPEGTGQVHALWVETRFSRSSPDTPQGSDNLWLHLEAGPIPLQVIPPEPAQRLVADLQADREGWHLHVTDAEGQVPPGPLWGSQEITSFSHASARPLHDSPDGTWSAAWLENEWDEESEICLRIWSAAPGYVTAVVTETVPGTGEARCMSWATEPPLRQTFPSLEAAQAALAYPLYRPGFLPAGAQLEVVRVETTPYEPQGWGDAVQTYRLSDGGWLELSQQATAEPYAGFGWGPARYDPEANAVAVGQATGYAIRRFGWWQLDWKCGDTGLDLRAPVEALSLEELVAVAATVKSPDGTCPPTPTSAPPTACPAPPTATPTG